jgi:hypothetical protein
MREMNRRTNKWWFTLAFLCSLGCGSEGTESVGTVVEEEPNSPGNTDLTFFDREGEQQTPSTLPDTYEDSVAPDEPLDASWDPEVQTGDDDTAGGNLDALSGPDDGEETEPQPDTTDSTSPVASSTCLRITTEESPSWVAWFEVEVSASQEPGGPVLDNVALNAPVTASGQDGDTLPEYAVDGDLSSSWNAGDFAPAWLEVDLGEIDTLVEVRLRVAQAPAGPTQHRIEISEGCDVYETLHVFQGDTQGEDWLVYNTGDTPEDPPPVLNDPTLPRGLSWVRNNPMFISALSVSTVPPTPEQASKYFNEFNANAAHLWTAGLPTRLQGWQASSGPGMRWVSWVDDLGKSPVNGELIGGLAANPPGRIGYQIGDEPGLNGNGMEELMTIELGVDAVRAADPDALIVVNFSFWADELPEMLDYYGSQMDADVFSYDRYDMRYKEHETMSQFRDAGLKHDMPYWRYIRSYHEWDKSPETHTEIDYRWHAFVGMVYGYTGYTWFVYQATAPHLVASDFFPNQGGLEQATNERWQWAAQINAELKHMGRTITQLTSTDVRYVPGQALYLPDGLVEWNQGAGEDPYLTQVDVTAGDLLDVRDLALGFFVDDNGDHYVMVQNQQHPAADWPIDNAKEIPFELTFDFSANGDADSNTLEALNHKTGQIYELALEDTGSDTSTLKHTLPAGEPILFKYKTSNPFAQGL